MSPFQIVSYKKELISKFEKIMLVKDIGIEFHAPIDEKLIDAIETLPEDYASIVAVLWETYRSYVQITCCFENYKDKKIVSKADILNIEYSCYAANELELLLWENMMKSFCIDSDEKIKEDDQKAVSKFRDKIIRTICDVSHNELAVKKRFSELLSI